MSGDPAAVASALWTSEPLKPLPAHTLLFGTAMGCSFKARLIPNSLTSLLCVKQSSGPQLWPAKRRNCNYIAAEEIMPAGLRLDHCKIDLRLPSKYR